VNGSSTDPRSIYATENLGREGQAKAKRKLSGKDSDKALQGLLERDKDGMRAVIKAREAGKVRVVDHEETGKKDRARKRKRKQEDEDEDEDEGAKRDRTVENEASNNPALPSKNAYSAEVIKNLGFDPVARTGQRRGEDSDMQKKVRFYLFICTPTFVKHQPAAGCASYCPIVSQGDRTWTEAWPENTFGRHSAVKTYERAGGWRCRYD
jgi:minichromosome maintenance protein 10